MDLTAIPTSKRNDGELLVFDIPGGGDIAQSAPASSFVMVDYDVDWRPVQVTMTIGNSGAPNLDVALVAAKADLARVRTAVDPAKGITPGDLSTSRPLSDDELSSDVRSLNELAATIKTL